MVINEYLEIYYGFHKDFNPDKSLHSKQKEYYEPLEKRQEELLDQHQGNPENKEYNSPLYKYWDSLPEQNKRTQSFEKHLNEYDTYPFYIHVRYRGQNPCSTKSLIQNSRALLKQDLATLESSTEGQREINELKEIIEFETDGYTSTAPLTNLTYRICLHRYSMQEALAFNLLNSYRTLWKNYTKSLYNGETSSNFNRLENILKFSDFIPNENALSNFEPKENEAIKYGKIKDQIGKVIKTGLSDETVKKIFEISSKESERINRVKTQSSQRKIFITDPLLLFSAIHGLMNSLELNERDTEFNTIVDEYNFEKNFIDTANMFVSKCNIHRTENTLWNWHHGSLKNKFLDYLHEHKSEETVTVNSLFFYFLRMIPHGIALKTKFTQSLVKEKSAIQSISEEISSFTK